MTPTIEKLLALLDDEPALIQACIDRYADDEEKARIFFADQDGEGEYVRCLWWEGHAAVLAFRLRDECLKERPWCWSRAVNTVQKEHHDFPEIDYFIDGWITYAQPKHYIVAALIALELGKEST